MICGRNRRPREKNFLRILRKPGFGFLHAARGGGAHILRGLGGVLVGPHAFGIEKPRVVGGRRIALRRGLFKAVQRDVGVVRRAFSGIIANAQRVDRLDDAALSGGAEIPQRFRGVLRGAVTEVQALPVDTARARIVEIRGGFGPGAGARVVPAEFSAEILRAQERLRGDAALRRRAFEAGGCRVFVLFRALPVP